MYLQTGIKSNGDYAGMNMNIDGYEDTFCFFFILCASARERDVLAHTKETEHLNLIRVPYAR